jgi:hypothetical protein
VAVDALQLYDMHRAHATVAVAEGPDAAARRHRHWYRGPIVRGGWSVLQEVPSRAHGVLGRGAGALSLLSLAGCALIVAGCGGGAAQDAHEASGSFQLQVVHASFPAKQSVAHETALQLQVRNSGSHTVPNVAVTVDSFNYTSDYQELAADKRPIWAIEQGPGAVASPPVQSEEVSTPGGAETAYVNTWALGALAPGRTETFTWRVMPVKPGTHTVTYSVAAGLAGKAKAVLASGGKVQGHFTVAIAPAPPATHVDPNTGRIVPGALPSSP